MWHHCEAESKQTSQKHTTPTLYTVIQYRGAAVYYSGLSYASKQDLLT